MDEKDKKAKQKKDEAAGQAGREQQLRDRGVGGDELEEAGDDACRPGVGGGGAGRRAPPTCWPRWACGARWTAPW